MKKRLVVLLMAALMAVTTVTGCGSTNTEAADAVATENEATCAEEAYAPTREYAPQKSTGAQTDCYEVEEEYVMDGVAGGETYESYSETGFTSAAVKPLSTFAADVDTASYANMRRLIDQGYGIGNFPEGEVRVEEFINYFHYNYNVPRAGEGFGVDATISECPWNRSSKLMVLGVSTEDIVSEEKTPSNIVFLIDVSGSMNSSNKLPLLKEAMKLLVENLDENDRVSIVTYASGTKVVLENAKGSDHRTIMRAFDNLKAGGGTNGQGGIQKAYEIAEYNFIENGNNRIILATDGDFNIGISDKDGLCDYISEKKESGVFLSVLGFGSGNYNDVTAETLADSGNGNYSYIDSLSEAKKVLVDEMTQTLYTVAKDTKFQVEFNPALVSEYRLLGYENRRLNAEDFKDDTKDGGELGSGHQVTVVYEIKLADYEGDGEELKYQNSQLSDKGAEKDEWCTLSVAYKDPDKEESKYLEFPIGVNNYTKNPSEDFRFVTAVAEYAMALDNSEYLVDMTPEEAVNQAYNTVSKLTDKDEYRSEFEEILGIVLFDGNGEYWYD